MSKIEDILDQYVGTWMMLPDVIGAGITEFNGKECIEVMLTKGASATRKQIPSQIEGFDVVFQESDEFHAQ